jgi:predicted transposase YdaD
MDHDRLFKELLTTFFQDFLEVFCPELAKDLDPGSIEFLDKEVFTDVTRGERHEVDLIAKARFRGQPLAFLIHVEPQARQQTIFPQRMFSYFARLHAKYNLPVYPIAVFSYETPREPEPDEYRIDFPDLAVLSFRFRLVQLNQLAWQDFENRTSPIVAALMSNMRRESKEGVRVKLACLRMLARLQLDPARRELISGFVDSYLRLTMKEEEQFEQELQELNPREREGVMEIVTSWMERGLNQGRQEGRQEGWEHERKLVLRQLRKRLGKVDLSAEAQVETLSAEDLEQLGEALLDFNSPADLDAWLQAHR